MKMGFYKGKRIRAKDKYLVYRSMVKILLPCYLILVLVLNIGQIRAIPWQELHLLQVNTMTVDINVGYLVATVISSGLICGLLAYVYLHLRKDACKRMKHRQALARMILENKWYESESVQSDSFFKDLKSSKSKERISRFPKMYYLVKDNRLRVTVEITMGRYQEPLMKLEKKLESGLGCELVRKELKDAFLEYTFIYNLAKHRISIDEVVAKNGQLKLMDSMYWKYDKLPHMLIAGSTGGGYVK